MLEFGQSHYEFDSLDKMFDEVKKTDIKRQKQNIKTNIANNGLYLYSYNGFFSK